MMTSQTVTKALMQTSDEVIYGYSAMYATVGNRGGIL